MLGRHVVVGCIVVSMGCTGAATTSEPTAVATAPAESAPDAQAILARMKERYRSAKTYRDEGTFIDVIRPGTPEELVTRARFRTRWIAPGRVSFELREDASNFFGAKRLAVWTPRSGDTKTLFLDRVEDESSLDGALYALQGVSHGLTGLVPRWLMEGGCRCTASYELHGTVACGSSTCFELSGVLREDHRVTLFIDTTTSALRKYVSGALIKPSEPPSTLPREQRERLSKLPRAPFQVESTAELEPIFDGPVSDTELEIDPASNDPWH